MKKMKVIFPILFCVSVSIMVACSKGDNDTQNPQDKFNKADLIGWWIANGDSLDYARRYFGSDNVYQQDMSNWNSGIATGTWSWHNQDSLSIQVFTDSVYFKVLKLTPDSLKINFVGMIRGYHKQ